MYLQIYRGGILTVLLCYTGILVLDRIGMNELFTRQVLEMFLFSTLLDMLGTISCGLAKVLYLPLALSSIQRNSELHST